jgi:hypothetical protein
MAGWEWSRAMDPSKWRCANKQRCEFDRRVAFQLRKESREETEEGDNPIDRQDAGSVSSQTHRKKKATQD